MQSEEAVRPDDEEDPIFQAIKDAMDKLDEGDQVDTDHWLSQEWHEFADTLSDDEGTEASRRSDI